MSTLPKAFHGCFGRTLAEGKFAGDASEFIDFSSSEWKQVKGKNSRKFDTKKISNSKPNWNVVSNSNMKVNLAVAPRAHSSPSSPKKPRLPSKKPSVIAPKSLMDLPLTSFSDTLHQLVSTQHSFKATLDNVDLSLTRMKKDLSNGATLLLLHKALARKLHTFQQYDAYLDCIDSLRDIAGQSKLQSIKIKEGMAHWEKKYQTSINLLDDFAKTDASDLMNHDNFANNDCIKASSDAYEDEFYDNDWETTLCQPLHDNKCRYIGSERKRPTRLCRPSNPILHSKYFVNNRIHPKKC
jgi:hypothetical protein